jgi:hypothetical protein
MRRKQTHCWIAALTSGVVALTSIVLIGTQADAATPFDQLSAYIPASTLSP